MRKALPVIVISLLLAAASWPSLAALAQQTGTPPPDSALSLDELHLHRRYGEPLPISSAALAPTQLATPHAVRANLLDWNRAVAMAWNYPTFDLIRFDRDHPFGAPWRLTYNSINEIDPRLNHTANRLVYIRKPNKSTVSVMNIDGSGQVNLTDGRSVDLDAIWSPDDAHIAFDSDREGTRNIYAMNADGSNLTRLTVNPSDNFRPAWSPDGQWIAWFKVPVRGTAGALWLMHPDGTQPHLIADGLRYPQDLLWSPDSTQLAFDYDADQDGWTELAVINADGRHLTTIYDPSSYVGAMLEPWPSDWSTDGYIYYTEADFSPYCSSSGCWYQLNTSWIFRILPDGSGHEAVAADGWHSYLSFDIEPLDRDLPSSSMSPLPAVSPYSMTLQWSGQDVGPSGLNDFDVEYKDGVSGAWTDQLIYDTTVTNTVFWGQSGHTYYFRVRARDNAFNVEAWPATYDAVTTIESAPPITTLDPLPRFARGPLTVSWHGVDPGDSGISVYYLQYQDMTLPGWHDWLAGINADATFIDSLPGHTYEFRVRALDRANNLENWSAPTQPVTCYAWGVTGSVADHSGRPVVGLTTHLTPDSVGTADNTRQPFYGAYALQADAYQFGGQQAGYAPLPTTTLPYDPARDTRLDLFLPPLDNVINNGDFEAAGPLGWQTTGALTTSIDVKHTGQQAARLGSERPEDTIETLFNGWATTLAVDADQTVHLLTLADLGAGYTSVQHASRPVTGTWPVAPTRIITASGSVSILQAAPDAAGGLHIVGVWGNSTKSNAYYCHYTPTQNGCLAPTALTAYTNRKVEALTLYVDPANNLHLIWASAGTTYYRTRPSGGGWESTQIVADGNSGGAYDLGLDQSGALHVIWSQSSGTSTYTTFYTRKPDGGAWLTPTVLLQDVGSPPPLAVTADGTLHAMYEIQGALYAMEKQSDQAPVITRLDNSQWYNGAYLLRTDQAGNIHAVVNGGSTVYQMVKEPGGRWQRVPGEWTSLVDDSRALQLDDNHILHVVWHVSGGSNLFYQHTPYLSDDESHRLSQTLTLPPALHRPVLSFMYRSAWGGVALPLTAQLDNGFTVTTVYSTVMNSDRWQHAAIDVSAWAGQTITLTFQTQQARGTPYVSAYIDDVALGSSLTPAVTAISVSGAETTAGVPITITGDNFLATPAGSIGSTPLIDVQWIDEHTLIATLPALPPGQQGPIRVVNPGGQAAVLDVSIEVGHLICLPLMARNAYH